MTSPEIIAAKFAELALAIDGVESAFDHQPERIRPIPAVTMTPVRVEQDDVYTGPSTENAWEWLVDVYVDLGTGRNRDFRSAQVSLCYELIPALLAIVRADPSLGGTANRATLTDEGEEPDFDTEASLLAKTLRLRAETTEL